MYRGAWPHERCHIKTRLGLEGHVLVPVEDDGTVDVVDLNGALVEGVKPENVTWAEVR
ncbi:hypothetical protein ACH4YO_07975 [Streptomyces noursei]|uniref:hypothetical protein n=1 Tax=Streptomyces noursei TaxID=1971 RepID=UPI0033E0D032